MESVRGDSRNSRLRHSWLNGIFANENITTKKMFLHNVPISIILSIGKGNIMFLLSVEYLSLIHLKV